MLNSDGLALWREADCGEWKATAAEIGQDLTLLEVPHTIVTAYRFPLANSWNKKMCHGEEVRIAEGPSPPGGLACLATEAHRQPPPDCPGWSFMFFAPKPEGMGLMCFALAAD
ncbi:hypothetical protein [Streptomyces sp. 1222.5]|uniref:hypothetical protein n=1 Tax=Streptomyces sp. 1222.5 TaxID=1881026 RepID=UPI003EB8B59B